MRKIFILGATGKIGELLIQLAVNRLPLFMIKELMNSKHIFKAVCIYN
jgi:1-deoxy-D-xylulose 5-phosphate reductoisomerase